MAIIKHKASHNARYADVLDYYTYQHVESAKTGHYEPVLDENGLMIERDDYAVAYITASGVESEPELWASACMRTNIRFGKNMAPGDRKNHEYIIAHPAEDNMTVKELLEEGKAFAQDNLAGYDCLIGAHDNHVHITINSVRELRRKRAEDWMMRDDVGDVLPCEMEAGGKHQDSPGLRQHLNNWVLEYCRQHGYTQKDNNAIAAVHRTERHGSKNAHMKAALLEAAARSRNMTELCQIMVEEYGMDVKVSSTGSTVSILYPGNEKYVRLRTLGMEPEDLTNRFVGDAYLLTREEREKKQQEQLEKKMRKQYREWLEDIRKKNVARAEDMITMAEYLLAEELRGFGQRYYRSDFQDLNYLIRNTSYLYASLLTEKEKANRLLTWWEQAGDISLSAQERYQHRSYVQWCGCDPDSELELKELQLHCDSIDIQRQSVLALHTALRAEWRLWKGKNEMTYAEEELQWLERRERDLLFRLKEMRTKGDRIHTAYYFCKRAALRAGRSQTDLWDKVDNLDVALSQNYVRRFELKQKIKTVRRQKEETKRNCRDIKKNLPKG